jgi:hypothetical protein
MSTEKAINKAFGSDNVVFVWENDAQLKEVLQQTDPNLIHDIPVLTSEGQERINDEYMNNDFTHHYDVQRLNAYDNLKNEDAGSRIVTSSRVSDGQHSDVKDVMFMVKADTSADKKLDDMPHSYPRASLKEQADYTAFFSLISSGINNISKAGADKDSTLDTPTVAVADVAFSLISLKQTGNLDEWNLNLKAQRMTTSDDLAHMTSEYVDKALEGVTHDTVKNMSDKEIMQFAGTRITAVEKLFKTEMRSPSFDKDQAIMNTHLLYNKDHQSKDAAHDAEQYFKENNAYYKDKMSDPFFAKEATQLDSSALVKEYSTKAMEASLNNLVYQGQLEKKGGDFVDAVKNHISRFGDADMKVALDQSMAGGKFDAVKFSAAAHLNVDFDSHVRLEQNTAKMTSHMNEFTGVRQEKEKGFFSSFIGNNLSASIQERYASKVQPAHRTDYKPSMEQSFSV